MKGFFNLLCLDQEVSGEITVSLDEEGNTRFVLQQTADALPTT